MPGKQVCPAKPEANPEGCLEQFCRSGTRGGRLAGATLDDGYPALRCASSANCCCAQSLLHICDDSGTGLDLCNSAAPRPRRHTVRRIATRSPVYVTWSGIPRSRHLDPGPVAVSLIRERHRLWSLASAVAHADFGAYVTASTAGTAAEAQCFCNTSALQVCRTCRSCTQTSHAAAMSMSPGHVTTLSNGRDRPFPTVRSRASRSA